MIVRGTSFNHSGNEFNKEKKKKKQVVVRIDMFTEKVGLRFLISYNFTSDVNIACIFLINNSNKIGIL